MKNLCTFTLLVLSAMTVPVFATLSAPQSNSPSGQIFNTVQPTFSWNAVSGASAYILSVHRQSEDNYEFEIRINATSFKPGNLNSEIPGASVNPLITTEITYLIPNTKYNWWVRAVDSQGVAGSWSSTKSFECVNTSLLGVGLHSHVGYPREVGALVDSFAITDCANIPTGGHTSWATMDINALVAHANGFGDPFFIHSGANWQLSYHPYFGWSSTNHSESNASLTGLTTTNLVLHPLVLPKPVSESLGNDVYGNLSRKTLALIGADYNGREAVLISQDPVANGFGFSSKDLYYRFRVPGMFNIMRYGMGTRPTDQDLYGFNNGYTKLTFNAVASNSYEGKVENFFLNYLVYLANKTAGKAKYILVGNEPEGIVPLHPQIYARLIDKIATKFSNRSEKVVLGNFATGPTHLSYLELVKQEFLSIYASNVIGGKIRNKNCPFQASSIDFYLDDNNDRSDGDPLTYDEIAAIAGAYKKKVKEIRDLFPDDPTPMEFFIKETSFSPSYYCKRAGLLATVNGAGSGSSLPINYQYEVKSLISFFKQLGFSNIGWFNQFGTPANHGDLLIGTTPVSGTAMTETRLGSYLKSLN